MTKFILTGPKPKLGQDAFEDLLGTSGFAASAKKNEPKTMKDMRKDKEYRALDPDEIKVRVSGVSDPIEFSRNFIFFLVMFLEQIQSV